MFCLFRLSVCPSVRPSRLYKVCVINSSQSFHRIILKFFTYRVSQKTWTFFENTITPSFMEETFQYFLCL